MKSIEDIGLKEVQAVYSGPEGELWELIIGEQIHIGGFVPSMDTALQFALGKKITISPDPQMTGALGAAILASRKTKLESR
jgi:hypothetical protein